MKESDIQSVILNYLNAIGAYTIKVITASRNGVPDILCCYQSYFIGIEVKTPAGKVSALQEENILKIQTAGGIAIIARSVDDVVNVISAIDKHLDKLNQKARSKVL